MTASRGSGFGTSGTDTSPAPSLLRPDVPAELPELMTETEWPDVSPASDRESRPETERREVEDREADEREEREERVDRVDREPADPDEPRDPVGADRAVPGPPPAPEPPPVPGPRPRAGRSAVAAASPVGGEEIEPVGDTTGARPQMSQYSSPPPTSSYSPSQSGR
ncbi:hypothetical protein [Streptomyces sp. DW26H14]|uniref:hypothetical protein n=1 Tax=Streptomyces sp. DW26H14 TaxID=3435395 RepID=UPI00403DDEE2